MVATDRLRLNAVARGGLQVWEMPGEGRQYVLGADTAGGGPQADYSVCAVLDAETCDLVAVWRERMAPIPWGRKCAMLGWFYNEGLLAFETGASAHGLSANHAAIGFGYQRIYKRQRLETIERDTTDRLGWVTNVATKATMIGRIHEALEQGLKIPSRELLQELKEQRLDENNKVFCEHHDDLMDAYAIALLVRDQAWVVGLLKTERKRPLDDSERFWASRDSALGMVGQSPRRRMYDGI